MTIKHTQGPWKAVFKHGQSGPDYYNIVDNDDVKLCEVIDTSTADLIASAPDMLEALEEVERSLHEWNSRLPNLKYDLDSGGSQHLPLLGLLKKINLAVTKAKGEL